MVGVGSVRSVAPVAGAVPDGLAPVVAGLLDSDVSVVTLEDLEGFGLGGWSPSGAAQVLRRAGWLFPLRCRGAWRFGGASCSGRTSGFLELRARLRVRSDTPGCVGGRSVAQVHGWFSGSAEATIGMPPRVKVPRCLEEYRLCRWVPQIPLDEVEGLPVWKPETLVVFMGARPKSFRWAGISEWLQQACQRLDEGLLLAELEGRPRAVWMKTAYITQVGERPTLSDVVVKGAPANTRGPYLFGERNRYHGPHKREPVWSPEHEVVDYVFPRWWNDNQR